MGTRRRLQPAPPPPPPNTLRQRTVVVDDNTWESLDYLAAENGRNRSDEIRIAILEHLRKYGLEVDEPAVTIRGRRGDGRVPKGRVS